MVHARGRRRAGTRAGSVGMTSGEGLGTLVLSSNFSSIACDPYRPWKAVTEGPRGHAGPGVLGGHPGVTTEQAFISALCGLCPHLSGRRPQAKPAGRRPGSVAVS